MELNKQTCSVCGGQFSPSQMMTVDDVNVCGSCKPSYVQALQEGAPMQGAPAAATANAEPKKPVFCTVMFSVDLGFSLLRGPVVLLGLIGLSMMLNQDQKDPLVASVFLEIASGALIFLFGVSGDIALLLKKKFGIVLGVLNILATLASIGCGLWQALIQFQEFEAGTPEFMGGVIGLTVVLLFRVGLLIAFAAALFKFANWHKTAYGQ